MPSSQKLDLENRIFARAARVRAEVDGAGGELISPSPDACLQVMLSVYNAFFADENRAFLGPGPKEENELFWREFERERVCLPGLWHKPGVPFFIQDYATELFWAAR